MSKDTESTSTKPVHMLRRISLYLPMLTGPLFACAMVLYYYYLTSTWPGDEETQKKLLKNLVFFCEFIAPWILTVTCAFYWVKAIYTRNLTYVIIFSITVALLLRELHWDHTIKIVIFPLLGICFLWMIIWKDLVDPPLKNWSHTIFFISALATYGLGQFIEKRLFRFVPGEDIIHTNLEEVVECAGHMLFLMAAIFGSWKRRVLTSSRDDKGSS